MNELANKLAQEIEAIGVNPKLNDNEFISFATNKQIALNAVQQCLNAIDNMNKINESK